MALLYLMGSVGDDHPDWAPEIVAAHANHGLRKRAADADQKRVERLAARLGIPFRLRVLDPEAIRGRRGASLEEAARDARYRALADIVRRSRCDALVLAHHQDDLAETFFMRLLRGSGLTGLGGFGLESEVAGLRVLRPLIEWTRDELRAVARAARLDWGEDATNRDLGPMRNRVRHRLLPYLEKTTDHPPAARMLARTARRLAVEGEALRVFVGETYTRERLERSRPRRVGLPRDSILRHDAAFAPYLVRLLMMDILESAYPPSETRTRELVEFALDARSGALLQSERNVVVWMSPDGVVWAYRKPERRIPREKLIRVFEKT